MVVFYLKSLEQCIFISLEPGHILIELTKEAIPDGQYTFKKLSSNYLTGSEISEDENNSEISRKESEIPDSWAGMLRDTQRCVGGEA